MMKRIKTLMHRLGQLPCDTKASVMVEAALILPIFFAILAMCIELAMLATTKYAVNYAAYAACRAGIVNNGKLGPMKIAAAMALSPVAQSNFVNTRKDIEWQVARTVKYCHNNIQSYKLEDYNDPNIWIFLKGFATAYAQFNIAASYAEYFAEGWSGSPFLGAINEVERLNPDPKESGNRLIEKHLDLNKDPFKKYVRDGLFTEDGKQERGIAFTDPTAVRYMRLRVRVKHSHKLFFPFLRLFFLGWNALPWGYKHENFPSHLRSLQINRIILSSVCTMRMQSNLMVKED